jgi:hypothetical protein
MAQVAFRAMSLLTQRSTAPRPPGAAPTKRYPVSAPAAPIPAASQMRAARRRAARRDEQAVSSWLRELATRPR